MFTNDELHDIAREILEQYRLSPDGIHGIIHWGRVLETGMLLAEKSGANVRVVQLFALFHDSCRENDGRDPEHGARGAALAGTINGGLTKLSPEELLLLQDACTRHTHDLTEADITVQTCWDADRLDLLRVGHHPDPLRLCTDAARDPDMVAWANRRGQEGMVTTFSVELLLDRRSRLPITPRDSDAMHAGELSKRTYNGGKGAVANREQENIQETTGDKDVLTILHVEDDDTTRELCRELLRVAFPDAQIHEAKNGHEALAAWREHPPTLLITNVVMPAMTGIELIRTLQRDGREIPTVITSGFYTADRCEQEGIRLGEKMRFLRKPFEGDAFISAVRSVI